MKRPDLGYPADLRQKFGLLQQDLNNYLGMKPGILSSIESHRRSLPKKALFTLIPFEQPMEAVVPDELADRLHALRDEQQLCRLTIFRKKRTLEIVSLHNCCSSRSACSLSACTAG